MWTYCEIHNEFIRYKNKVRLVKIIDDRYYSRYSFQWNSWDRFQDLFSEWIDRPFSVTVKKDMICCILAA